MIRADMIQEVERLLAEGKLSHREISRRPGVGRTTVGAVAAGRRSSIEDRRSQPHPIIGEVTVPPRRCQGCGGLVYLPCVLCNVRDVVHRRQQQPKAAERRWPIEHRPR